MPEMGGLEATVAIRAREGSAAAPRADRRADGARHAGRSRALSVAGMDGYLSKPIDVDDLYTTVESFASPGRVTMLATAGQAAAQPRPRSRAFDEPGAMRRTGDDRQLLKQNRRRSSRAAMRRRCARLERAIERRDGEALRVAAHTLKGSVANVGGQIAREQRRAPRRDGPIESTGCGSAGARRAERRVGRPLRRVRGGRPGRAAAQARVRRRPPRAKPSPAPPRRRS